MPLYYPPSGDVSGDIVVDSVTSTGPVESNGIENTGYLIEGNAIRPSATTGVINDYAPTDFANARVIYQDTSGSTTLNGIAGGADGRRILLVNIGANTLTMAHEAAASVAANRFIGIGAANVSLTAAAMNAAELIYDATAARWRILGMTRLPSLTVDGAAGITGALTVTGAAQCNGTLLVAGTTTVGGGSSGTVGMFRLQAVISPTAIGAGNTNNYNPTGFSTAITVRQDVSAATCTLTGLSSSTEGRTVIIHNISNTAINTLTLAHDDTGNSTAANCFLLPDNTSMVVPRNGSVTLRYDAASSRWRVIR